MIDRTGQQVRGYHLARLLGQGRFSQVYLANHPDAAQPLALKLIAAQLSPPEQGHFLEEARNLSALAHPHRLPLHTAGLLEDQPFLVMDYAPQGHLRLEPGTRLAPEITITYAHQMAAALAASHSQGVLHQNLKPTNLLLTYQQQVLLSDWALESVRAHLAASARQEQPEDIAYLAPEQLRGPGQPASDQYALGLLVYEWLTGGPPFTGSYFRLYEQHCYAAPPSLRARVPGLPPALEAVVLQALAKDPAQRFPDIATFADELARAALPPQEGTEGTPSLLQRLRAAWRRTE